MGSESATVELSFPMFVGVSHSDSTVGRVAYHKSSPPTPPVRFELKYTVSSSLVRTAYISLKSGVFSSATGTGVDQSPKVSALRGDVSGAARYHVISPSSAKDRLMFPPLKP